MANGPFYEVGLHVAEVVSQGLTKASTGTKQFVLGVKILGTPTDDGGYAPHRQQYNRTIYMALTDKTMPFVADALKRLNYTGTTISQLDPSHPSHTSFAGQQVDLWCKHEQDQSGGTREKWQISSGASSLKLDPLDQREARELDMLFGKALGNTSTPQAKPSPFANTEITDDDIPF